MNEIAKNDEGGDEGREVFIPAQSDGTPAEKPDVLAVRVDIPASVTPDLRRKRRK